MYPSTWVNVDALPITKVVGYMGMHPHIPKYLRIHPDIPKHLVTDTYICIYVEISLDTCIYIYVYIYIYIYGDASQSAQVLECMEMHPHTQILGYASPHTQELG